jgi:ribosomal-protein-alanine N-acetyltransferase
MPQYEIILETPRLLLRKKVIEDAPFFFEMNADPLVNKYTGDKAFDTLKQSEDIINYVIGQYNANGYGRLMVVEKETNTPLGWCGLKYHPDTGETDIGYRFMQKHWGKGYATESAKACMDYGFNQLHLNHIIGNAAIENTASVNVFKKLGMTYLSDTLIGNWPSVTYELYRKDHR